MKLRLSKFIINTLTIAFLIGGFFFYSPVEAYGSNLNRKCDLVVTNDLLTLGLINKSPLFKTPIILSVDGNYKLLNHHFELIVELTLLLTKSFASDYVATYKEPQDYNADELDALFENLYSNNSSPDSLDNTFPGYRNYDGLIFELAKTFFQNTKKELDSISPYLLKNAWTPLKSEAFRQEIYVLLGEKKGFLVRENSKEGLNFRVRLINPFPFFSSDPFVKSTKTDFFWLKDKIQKYSEQIATTGTKH